MKGVSKELKQLIGWARDNGWDVGRRKSNHLQFSKPNCYPVFSGATLSDRRAIDNIRAELKRSERSAR